MKEDYKKKYEELIRELKWYEEYHSTMANHYYEYGRPDLAETHKTAWSEFYLLLDRFDDETNE